MKMLRFGVNIVLLGLTAMSLAQARLVVSVEGRGDFTIRLYTKEAPQTTARIMELAEKGFYNGLRFHRSERVPKPFLVQVGDPKSRTGDINDPSLGTNGTGKSLAYEDSGMSHDLGAVGLARLPDSRDSGDSQFYIMLSPARFMDRKYTVFGTISAGMDVVNKIEKGDRITGVRVFRQ